MYIGTPHTLSTGYHFVNKERLMTEDGESAVEIGIIIRTST